MNTVLTTVSVFQRHIDKGVCFHTEKCAIAVALKEKTGLDVMVGKRSIAFYRATAFVARVSIPERMCVWIRGFDFGRQMEPETFELPIPTEVGP